MRFSTKVFLATSGISTTSALVASALILGTSQDLYRRQYETDYRQKLEQLAGDFKHLEEAYDRAALNAAKVIAEIDSRNRSHLNKAQLVKLAQELGVSGISIADSSGAFIAASSEKPADNLFSFCSSYRDLVKGDSTPRHTPLIPDKRDPSIISKYTMIPSHDGRRIIDVSMRFDDFSKPLQRLVDDDSDIVRVWLRSPSGQLLGDVRQTVATSYNQPSQIRVTIDANQTDCCECRTRKLVDESKPYVYEFAAEASQTTLNRAIRDLRIRFALVVAALIALSLILSLWVSRLLVRKILMIRRAVDRISLAGDFSNIIPIETSGKENGSDELDALATHFNRFFHSMNVAQSELIEAKKTEARAAVASQVAHDIRSPLTTMMLALNQLQDRLKQAGTSTSVTEMISVLSHGISRVNGIARRLSSTHTKKEQETVSVEDPRLTLVDKLLFDVAQEHALKLLASQKFRIEGFESIPAVWSVVQVTELQAALSNLLNNAVEAIGSTGEVCLSALSEDHVFRVTVRDSGVGIPAENLARVFEREFTSGKEGGSGLGLYQAKKALEWAGGKMTIESQVGKGTSVSFSLPIEKKPAWISDKILIGPDQTLIIADDDPTVRSVLRKKAENAGIRCQEFETIGSLEDFLPSLGPITQFVFILDQYASSTPGGLTGTSLIKKHGLGAQAYLCTTEFDDPLIQNKVKSLKTRLIPKPWLGKVEFELHRAEAAQGEK